MICALVWEASYLMKAQKTTSLILAKTGLRSLKMLLKKKKNLKENRLSHQVVQLQKSYAGA
jgi:hypothetical protein